MLKPECRQITGSFKFRGAYYALLRLRERSPHDEFRRGVVTASSGNFGHALAVAGQMLGTAVTVFLPRDVAAGGKAQAVLDCGGRVLWYERGEGDRDLRRDQFARATGATVISSSDNGDVIAGQGTVALEMYEDGGVYDMVVAPVAGGGLLAGTLLATNAMSPHTRVMGVEPLPSDDMQRSLASDSLVRVTFGRGASEADALLLETPARTAFDICRGLLRDTDIALVSDDAMALAMHLLRSDAGLTSEMGGAAALAALVAGVVSYREGAHIGVVVSGGNIERGRFERLAERGRVIAERWAN